MLFPSRSHPEAAVAQLSNEFAGSGRDRPVEICVRCARAATPGDIGGKADKGQAWCPSMGILQKVDQIVYCADEPANSGGPLLQLWSSLAFRRSRREHRDLQHDLRG